MSGKLDLIIGCMFSGKTTELQNRVRSHKLFNDKLIIINHVLDKRYNTEHISSHDNIHINSKSINKLEDFVKSRDYIDNTTIFIDEAQFFSGLKEFVQKAVDVDNKWIIASGLDGDFERKKFGEILDLIPIADSITKKRAICVMCKDGTPGIFSKKTECNTSQQIDVGIHYIAVCRHHYLN